MNPHPGTEHSNALPENDLSITLLESIMVESSNQRDCRCLVDAEQMQRRLLPIEEKDHVGARAQVGFLVEVGLALDQEVLPLFARL